MKMKIKASFRFAAVLSVVAAGGINAKAYYVAPSGGLPVNSFARLVAGSDLIDAGTNVGLPVGGKAPDLGAFEFGPVLVVHKPPAPDIPPIPGAAHPAETGAARTLFDIRGRAVANPIAGGIVVLSALAPGFYIGPVRRPGHITAARTLTPGH